MCCHFSTGPRGHASVIQRHSSRSAANHQPPVPLSQQPLHPDADHTPQRYHDPPIDPSPRQQQAAAVLASPLHTLATAAVIMEQNNLAAAAAAAGTPRDHQVVGAVMPTRQLIGQQLPHLVAMGGVAVAHNTNNNQNSAVPSGAPPTSDHQTTPPMIYHNYGHHFVDGRPQNEPVNDSPVNFGLSSPPFVHNIFAWPTVAAAAAAATPQGLATPTRMQGAQNDLSNEARATGLWSNMMVSFNKSSINV